MLRTTPNRISPKAAKILGIFLIAFCIFTVLVYDRHVPDQGENLDR